MEEKYRLCDDTLSDLLAWIGEIEDRLANQDVVQEDVNQLRNQINILKVILISVQLLNFFPSFCDRFL